MLRHTNVNNVDVTVGYDDVVRLNRNHDIMVLVVVVST